VSARDTYLSILNVLRTLQETNLLYFYQSPIFSITGDVAIVSGPNHATGADYRSETSFATLLQYRKTLEDQSYLAVLRNGAIIKGLYIFRRDKVINHSLLYWPCPLEIPDDDIIQLTPLDALDMYSTSWEKYVRFRTPLRFDYDPINAKSNHPASHLHIQVSDCRIGVERPLGFATFIRFIFQYFHRKDWESTDIWNDLPDELEDSVPSCLSESEQWLQHIAWKRHL
jgi:hypothetical protein